MKHPKQYHLPASSIEPIAVGFGACLASDRITVDGMNVGLMYREAPDAKVGSDSGWRFFSGDETQDYVDDADNLCWYDLNTIANYDRSIVDFLSEPPGSAFGRTASGDFIREPFPKDPAE